MYRHPYCLRVLCQKSRKNPKAPFIQSERSLPTLEFNLLFRGTIQSVSVLSFNHALFIRNNTLMLYTYYSYKIIAHYINQIIFVIHNDASHNINQIIFVIHNNAFSMFQTSKGPSQLAHITDYWQLSSHSFQKTTKGGLWSRASTIESHKTDLILSLSNFWFVRKHQATSKKIETKAKDFHASLKLASTVFNSENAKPAILEDGSELYFDKNGVIVPLFALQSLMADAPFEAFMRDIYHRYTIDSSKY